MSRLKHCTAMITILLAGCATPSLTLLTSESGKQGSVALLDENDPSSEYVVNELNSRTNLSGKPKTSSIDPSKLGQRQQALLAGLPPEHVDRTLYFLEGTTTLTEESKPGLEYLKAEIAKRPGAEVLITGYTDTVGSPRDNDELSQRRAEEVLKALSEQGIELGLMTAVGRGERDLLVQTPDGTREPRNRRVEVTVR